VEKARAKQRQKQAPRGRRNAPSRATDDRAAHVHELAEEARRQEASRAVAEAFLHLLRQWHPEFDWGEVRSEDEGADRGVTLPLMRKVGGRLASPEDA
jgi:hypothetical protein